MESFCGVQELCGGSGGEQRCGDLAGDEAAFADAREDDAMASLGGCGEEGGDLFEGFALRTFEPPGNLLEGGGFDAD